MFEKFKARRKYNKLVAEGNAAADSVKELLDIFEESLHKYSPMIRSCGFDKEKIITAMMKAHDAVVGDTENIYAVVYNPVLIDEITHEDEGRMLDLSEYGCTMFCIPKDGTDAKALALKNMEAHDLAGMFHIWLAFFNNETEMGDGELRALCEELYTAHLKLYAAKLRMYNEALYHDDIDGLKANLKPLYMKRKDEALATIRTAASRSVQPGHINCVKVMQGGTYAMEYDTLDVDSELYEQRAAVAFPVEPKGRELTDDEVEELYKKSVQWFDEPATYNSKCVVGRNVAMYEQLRLTTDKLVKSITIGN